MRHAYNAVLHVYNVQDEARKKSFQSLSGIGGLSDRSLAKVVQWIRDHPEVPVARYVALSLAKEQQAIGRARRIGRDEMQILSVVRFLTHSTVEETIKHDVQRRKNDAASAALRGSEAQRPGDPDYLTGSILARLFAADG